MTEEVLIKIGSLVKHTLSSRHPDNAYGQDLVFPTCTEILSLRPGQQIRQIPDCSDNRDKSLFLRRALRAVVRSDTSCPGSWLKPERGGEAHD